MSSSLRAILRRRKPERHRVHLRTRPRGELISALDLGAAGHPSLLMDTNVYIMEAAGRLHPAVEALLGRALLFHSSVCLSELSIGIANSDPAHPQSHVVRNHYAKLIEAIPRTRLVTPDEQTWLDAGVIAGTLARTQGLHRHRLKECLNDALIYLSAVKLGIPVLTADRDDFDLIQQLAPEGTFVHF